MTKRVFSLCYTALLITTGLFITQFLPGCKSSAKTSSTPPSPASIAPPPAPMSPVEPEMLAFRTTSPSPVSYPPSPNVAAESYDHVEELGFRPVSDAPRSTFSIDVDTASYANIRRFLNDGTLPPPDAVRIEEMVNYFRYDYAPPVDETPFSTHLEVARCPWNAKHALARIGLKGKEFPRENRPPVNLVFLLDVSGSMNTHDKLPLVQQSLRMLVEEMNDEDRIAIVVYAGASGLVLPSTSCDKKMQIVAALDELAAGGSTNGGAGIELAYRTASEHFIEGGINRVILATDGDFNVGITKQSALVDLIEKKREEGVFLTVLGFGSGNLKDSTMEKLASKGNGAYAYIDSLKEARKVLVEQASGTLHTIAKDVKIQVEFNPAHIASYRLLGYENRMLRTEAFNDDTVDAGEIGAGHTVTALYELIPVGTDSQTGGIDPLRYQPATTSTPKTGSEELFIVKLRYKAPDSDTSSALEFPFARSIAEYGDASTDFQFASAVAGFGMLLRNSEYNGNTRYADVVEWANAGIGDDDGGYRKELVQLVELSKNMSQRKND